MDSSKIVFCYRPEAQEIAEMKRAIILCFKLFKLPKICVIFINGHISVPHQESR